MNRRNIKALEYTLATLGVIVFLAWISPYALLLGILATLVFTFFKHNL